MSRRARKSGIAFVATLVLVALAAPSRAADPVAAGGPRRPNFLFVMTDDQRWDALGVVQREQGERARFPWFESPHMDRLAAEGVRFRNAFVTLSICSPSRAAYLTGRYNHLNGITNNNTPFPLDTVTYATLLRDAGYRTAYVGKWHMGEQRGQRPGFDHSASYFGHGEYMNWHYEVDGQVVGTKGWLDDSTTTFATDFLKANRHRPFAMVVAYKSPHSPRGGENLPERLANLYADDTSRPVPNLGKPPIWRAPPAEGAPPDLGVADEPSYRDYYRHLKGIDENLGRLLGTLDELGLADDTVVVYTSDNGYYLGEHCLGDKRSAYDESLRIPMLVRYPRLFGKGRTVDEMVLNIDLAPTFLDLAGVAVPAEMQGRSWKPLAAGERPADWRKSFLFEYFKIRSAGDTPTLVGIRTEREKLVTYPGYPEWTEVFDLAADPYEVKNLAADTPRRTRLEADLAAQKSAVGYRDEPAGSGAVVPATLPRPDGRPGDMTKKVQVYVLAGQSNMVGFGLLEGARPVYPSIFLAPDPAIRPGRMPIGNAAVLPLKVHRSAADGAAPGNGTFIEVPATGNYLVHAVHKDGTPAVVTLDGKEVYRREPGAEAVLTKVALERGKRYQLGGLAKSEGGGAAFWLEQVDLQGQGDLKTCIAAGKFPWFADDAGAWTVRNDVIYRDVRLSKEPLGSGGPLSATSNGGRTIGPEVPFGFVMGTYHDEPVLLIESSIGNRSLNWDFRPPSSGRTDSASEWEGLEYRLMIEGVRRVLDNIADVVPGYQGQGYEIAGFVWWQGHKDSGSTKEAYEKNLVNLIQDLRKEFQAPDMRAVIATVGFHGDKLMDGPWKGVWEAQMAVGDPQQHPEFAGTVASIDTRGFWRSPGDSPVNQDYHYNHNAETYALTGDALGRAMVALRGGKADKLVLPAAPDRDPDVATIYSDAVVTGQPTPEECRQLGPAVRPIILDKLIPEFLATAFGANSRSLPGLELKAILKGEKPARVDVGIDSQLDTLMSYYEAAGITDYGWKAVVPGMKTATWQYFSFDPPETQDLAKSNRYRPITFPAGMENWFAPDFDPAKAGWKQGAAPFGTWDGKLEARRPSCNGPLCGCCEPPVTLWEKEVLLMRQTFDLPPAKPGHVYRIILGGAGCDRSGEGFAIYVNGKPLTQVNGGFFRNTGIRGGYVSGDCLPEFKGGKVTIAVINFLRYTHFNNTTTYFGPRDDYDGKPVPPNGHVSLWLEEAQVPPAVLAAAAASQPKP